MIARKKFIRVVSVISACFVIIAVTLCLLIYNGVIWFVHPENRGFTVKGIDVARYQGDIDWHAVASQGISFTFVKATEGSSYSDPKFTANIVLSRENGIYSGAYHYFSGESPGETQAKNFITTVSDYGLDLPPVMDFEISKANRAKKESIIREAKVFLREIENHFGIKPIIYTTYESYGEFLNDGFDGYPLWFRDLMKEPKIGGNRDWLFWQYCNRGRLDGVDGKQKFVDLNVFNSTMDELESYISELTWRR